jgi:hypothetical protein
MAQQNVKKSPSKMQLKTLFQAHVHCTTRVRPTEDITYLFSISANDTSRLGYATGVRCFPILGESDVDNDGGTNMREPREVR